MSHSCHMVFLVVSMLAVIVLAVAVVGVVAVPAHRTGRDVLTAKGEALAEDARRRASGVVRRTDARMP